jgi:WD40 repeat protein
LVKNIYSFYVSQNQTEDVSRALDVMLEYVKFLQDGSHQLQLESLVQAEFSVNSSDFQPWKDCFQMTTIPAKLLPSGQPLVQFIGHRQWVRSVAISPDGSRMASGSDDKIIRIWNARELRLIVFKAIAALSGQ